ncbi:MAG: hypothetical protein WAL91_09200 [Propionicimonas sp.]
MAQPSPAAPSSVRQPSYVAAPTVLESEYGSLTASGLSPTESLAWAQRVDAAARSVRAAGLVTDWDGRLTVVIPAGEADFVAMAGTPADSASAVTTCTGGVSTILVNPAILDSGNEWLTSTLVHEGVHAALGSACVPTDDQREWATEGLAESVAAGADPATADRNHHLVMDYLADHPVPTALPENLMTLTDYALAQLAVDQVKAHHTDKADDLLDRAIHQASTLTRAETARVTGWYVAELARLAASA